MNSNDIALAADNRGSAGMPVEAVALRRLGPVILKLLQRGDAALARARTMRALSTLDDVALKDIGLQRSQIELAHHDPRYLARYTRI